MQQQKETRPGHKWRFVSVLTTTLLAMAVVLCLFVTVQSLSVGYVSLGGISVFRVVTGSMEPEIPVGALLLSQRQEIGTIAVNDVVCFRSKDAGLLGTVITHRVVGIYETPNGQTLLQTKGDANLTADVNAVTADNLIGRVVWHTGDGSKMAAFVDFLTSEFGFLACIVLPVLLIALWIFRDAMKSLKKEIVAVEKQLEQQENGPEAADMPAISDEEYRALYEQVAEELRKELEQHAEETVEHAEDPDSGQRDQTEHPEPVPTDPNGDQIPADG